MTTIPREWDSCPIKKPEQLNVPAKQLDEFIVNLLFLGSDRLFRRAVLFCDDGFDNRFGGRLKHCFVLFEKLFDVCLAADGVGNTHGVVLAEFVVNEELANHVHLKIRFRHAPNLAVSQRLHGCARCRFRLNHKAICKFIPNLSS